MDIVQAVKLAKNGDNAGFTYLYEKTYQSKYYLALKYVKDEETAKDVLQESYLKAFSKIDTLECPDKFSAWLGMIVANTAQNVLKKKNPTLFADVAPGYEVEFEVEDENTFNRPESACTQKETVELVHEILGTLSDAQRICILMYHIEGYSISEIAETLGCTENTVKSRLLYGRKAIKAKAEELQKKGHQLYVIAPGAILTYFLTREEEFLAADGTLDIVKNSMPNPTEAIKAAGTEAVKKGFLATVAGKVTLGVVAVCVIGAIAGGAMMLGNNDDENVGGTDTETEESQETEETQEPQSFDVTDEMYSQLLAGNITKEEFAFVLGYGPKEMSGGVTDIDDFEDIVLTIKDRSYYEPVFGLASQGKSSDNNYYKFDLAGVNRLMLVLHGQEFTEADNSTLTSVMAKVEGDSFLIKVSMPDSNFKYDTTILSAKVDGDVMTVEYNVTYSVNESGEGMEVVREYELIATLTKNADGLFYIESISARN